MVQPTVCPGVMGRPLPRSDIPGVLTLQRQAGALYLPWTQGRLVVAR